MQNKLGGCTDGTADHSDITYHVTRWSTIKAGGRKRKGVRSELRHLSSQETVRRDGALLSWGWMKTCLPMGRTE